MANPFDRLFQGASDWLPQLRSRPPLDRRRTLALRPLRNPDVPWTPQEGEGGADGENAAPVTLEIPLRRRPAPRPLVWLASRFAARRPPAAVRRVELDEVGSFVWRAADGSRTTREIIWKLAEVYKLNRRDAEAALFEFFRLLSSRNLLAFTAPEQRPAKPPAGDQPADRS